MSLRSTPARPRGTDAGRGPSGAFRHWWKGRSEIFVGLLAIGIGLFLGEQTLTMHVPDNSASPGPQFFPAVVAALMVVLGVALALQVIRRPAPEPEAGPADSEHRAHDQTGAVGELVDGERAAASAPATHSDWRTIGIVVGSVVLFALLLEPVGWLLSGALLFFGVAWAFGGKRPVFEAGVALVYSSVVQLAFVAGLGLKLPAGILGGVL